MKILSRALCGFALIFGFTALPALATNDIGKVITYTAGASVLRDGKTEALALHAGIRVSDTVQTDAGGRVKILFNDDSSVSLGPNTTMDMAEYADAGDTSAFSVNVPQGMIRAITGKIVDQNPGGFKMTSPEATVGIRGTIVTMHVEKGEGGKGKTTIFVENTLRSVHANGNNVPSGFKRIFDSSGSRQERITPDDRRHIGRELAFRGGQGSAAAAPEGTREGRRRSTDRFAAAGGSLAPRDTLNTDTGVTQNLTLANLQIASLGHVSGPHWGDGSGMFGFDVNLFSGQIANGYVTHAQDAFPGPDYYSSSLTGGTGMATSTGFTMTLSGSGTFIPFGFGPQPIAVEATVYNMSTIDLKSLATGDPVDSGLYINYGNGQNIAANVGDGVFSKK